MGDLLGEDGGQGPPGIDPGIVGVELVHRHGEDFLVLPRLVDHDQAADRPAADDGARGHRGEADHQYVQRVPVP